MSISHQPPRCQIRSPVLPGGLLISAIFSLFCPLGHPADVALVPHLPPGLPFLSCRSFRCDTFGNSAVAPCCRLSTPAPFAMSVTNRLIQYPAHTSLRTPRRFYLHLPSKRATGDSPENVNNQGPLIPERAPERHQMLGKTDLVCSGVTLALPVPPLMSPVTLPLSSTSNLQAHCPIQSLLIVYPNLRCACPDSELTPPPPYS